MSEPTETLTIITFNLDTGQIEYSAPCPHGGHAKACQTCKLEQQVAALTAQLAEAQRERDDLLAENENVAAAMNDALRGEARAQAKATALREALARYRDADLDAHRLANVLYNLPHRVQADGTACLTGREVDQLRDIRLAWESSSARARDVSADLGGQPPTGGQP